MKHTKSKVGTPRKYEGPAVQPRTRDVPAPEVEPTPEYTAIRFVRPDKTHYDVLRDTHLTPEERQAIKAQGPTALVIQFGIEWYLYIDAPAPAPGAKVVGHLVDGKVVRV